MGVGGFIPKATNSQNKTKTQDGDTRCGSALATLTRNAGVPTMGLYSLSKCAATMAASAWDQCRGGWQQELKAVQGHAWPMGLPATRIADFGSCTNTRRQDWS